MLLFMRGKTDPDWPALVASWKRAQDRLRGRMVVAPLGVLPRYVAGVDAAFSHDGGWVLAAAVVYDRQERRIIEVRRSRTKADIPYVPGFLSFREGPVVMAALKKLKHEFGAALFDGQGYAHPRRCGLAVYAGVTLDIVAVGVAKSRLIGQYKEPGLAAPAESPLMDHGERIGTALRTRTGSRPLFVSIGHRIDLPSAVALARACTAGFRLPEPTRQADAEVGKMKREGGGRKMEG